MKHINVIKSNCIEFYSSEITTEQDEVLWYDFIRKVISFRFLNKPICITTWNPQENAVSLELPNISFINSGEFVVSKNTIPFLSRDMLEAIILSEEFKLGTLRLFDIKSSMLKDDYLYKISEFIFMKSNQNDFPSEEMIWCDSDGEFLYWFNTEINKEDLYCLVNSYS
jgi:hypothetical protein